MLHWGVYFIVISVVFRELGTVYIGFFTLNQFVIIILFLAALFVKLIQRQDFSVPGKLTVALIAFGCYMWFSNFIFNQHANWGIAACTNYLRSLICYFLVIILIDTKKKFRLFVMSYIIASTAMVLTGNLYDQLTSGLNLSYTGARSGLEGLSEHYIKYAQYAMISLPLTYYFLKNSNIRFKRIMYSIILALLAFGGLFSGSRGAVLTLLVMIFTIAIIELRQRDQLVRSPGVLFSFAFITLFLFIIFWVKGGSELFGSLFSVFTGKPADLSLGGRLIIQSRSFTLFLDNPFFGAGIDSTRKIYGSVTHNQWLQILSELGVVGMVLAIIVVYFIFNNLFTAKRNAYLNNDNFMINIINGLMVSTFSMIFWGLYENIGLIQAEKILFMLFGLCVSIRQYTYTEKNIIK